MCLALATIVDSKIEIKFTSKGCFFGSPRCVRLSSPFFVTREVSSTCAKQKRTRETQKTKTPRVGKTMSSALPQGRRIDWCPIEVSTFCETKGGSAGLRPTLCVSNLLDDRWWPTISHGNGCSRINPSETSRATPPSVQDQISQAERVYGSSCLSEPQY